MHSLRLEPRRDWDLTIPVPNAFLPTNAIVLLKQHAGNPARCAVKEGDEVREGMVLGVPDGDFSAYVHSPIPGKVRSITTVRLPGGGECEAVEILLHGSFDRLGKRPERYIWKGMRRLDILQAIKAKGVVETTGRGFPLDRLLGGSEPGCDIVIPALDPEPYIRTETAIFASRTAQVLEAARIVQTLTEAGRIRVLIEATRQQGQEEIEALAAPSESSAIELTRIALSQAYTIGLASGHEGSKKKGSPIRLAPSLLVAIYDAVIEARAFVERYVTVAGGAIRRPSVLKARIGTPIGDLIEECGGFLEAPERLVLGGPLTGLPARDLDMPVTKTLGGILALTPPETRRAKVRPCIRCGLCREHCPVGIDPEAIMRDLLGGRPGAAHAKGLDSCVSCGICSYVCPSRLELSQTFAAHSGAPR
ncbi:MAG TPA: SLBB domain-containing protein [Rectinemataceae bacterium]|nr:SLBB domain-containing protein [Rectinemataceae bacterium]